MSDVSVPPRTENQRRPSVLRPALSYTRLPAGRRALARSAAFELIRAWALVRLRPFASFAPSLGTATSGDPEWDWHGATRPLGEVRWAVLRWTRATDGRFTCLMQAIAGQRLLARRNIASAVVLGVKPGTDLTAHAWLRVGPWVVLGAEEKAGHIPVASYCSLDGV